jgi:hypothetical protein
MGSLTEPRESGRHPYNNQTLINRMYAIVPDMTDNEAHNLTHKILNQIQADVARAEATGNARRFPSVKSHMTGLIGDVFLHERRILNIEDAILRLKSQLGPEDPQHWNFYPLSARGESR